MSETRARHIPQAGSRVNRFIAAVSLSMFATILSLAMIASSYSVSAEEQGVRLGSPHRPVNALANMTANAYLELSLDSPIVTAGTPITLYIDYHNIGVPHTTIHVTPTGLVAFEPPLSMPCKYDQHSNGCTAIGFRALASGVVTFTAGATGEVYDENCHCWYWGIANTIEPARLIIAGTIWRAFLPLVKH